MNYNGSSRRKGSARAGRHSQQDKRVVPDKRTITVLAALVIGMTLTSGILLILEPGPVAPLTGVTLQSIDTTITPEDRLFDIPQPLDWRAIIIHDSGTRTGSAETLSAAHEQLGKGGLAHHFVINNGSRETDGTIEIGFRWSSQLIGAYLHGERADWYNRHGIGICLIGDGDQDGFSDAQLRELIWLVRELQARFNIPKSEIHTQIGSDPQHPSPRFPDAWFRAQLLNPTLR